MDQYTTSCAYVQMQKRTKESITELLLLLLIVIRNNLMGFTFISDIFVFTWCYRRQNTKIIV